MADAVNTASSELVLVAAANADDVLSEASVTWKVLSAPFSAPTAEILVVTVEVCAAICASCGARVAATSCADGNAAGHRRLGDP